MAFNEGANVAAALRSLLAQEGPHLSRLGVTVVASGCTDDTVERARRASAGDPRVRILEQPRREGKASAVTAFLESASGAEVLVLETDGEGVALGSLFADLGKRDVQGVLLEGGPTLAWSAVEDRLVDRIVLYLAPKLIGGEAAATVLEGRGFAPIRQALPMRIRSVERIGEDLRVEADVHRDR